MAYTEKEIDNAYVYEKVEQGFFRVITECGDNCFLKGQSIDVGQIGKIIYYSDGGTYGLHKFVLDETVSIDFKKLVENYNKKWNTNIRVDLLKIDC